MNFFFVFFRKREEAMSSRVKNIEKITKELLAQILQWEEVRGPFMFAVRTYMQYNENGCSYINDKHIDFMNY